MKVSSAVAGLVLFLATLLLGTLPTFGQTSNPQAPSQAPQAEAQPPVNFNVVYRIADDDKVGQAIETEMKSQIAAAGSAVRVGTEAEQDAASVVEGRLISVATSDTQAIYFLVVTYHRKGYTFALYLGTSGDKVNLASAKDAAGSILGTLAEIAIGVEGDTNLVRALPVPSTSVVDVI